MDEHARGTLRFIKLFTELSFTSFQVTHGLENLPGMSQSEGGAGTNLHHIGGEEEQDEIWENNPGPKSHGGSRTRASVPRYSDIEVSLLCKPVGQEAFQDMNLNI